jgi:UDP-glucose 4-epimerase
LVAGGAGFIGSHLCDALLAGGHSVVCADNFFIGARGNVAHLAGNPAFKLYETDVSDITGLRGIFEREGIEYIFHLAANSDIQASALNPLIEYQNTYSTTFALLECARLFGARNFFFASTSAVYGEREGARVAEDAPGLEPISYYGGAKLGGEAMIAAYSYMCDLRSLVFRFPNVIGPRLTHGAVFDFIKSLRADNTRLRILGDGAQTKPYMHVSDLIAGILRFMDASPGVATYNIGVESQTSVTGIADIICEEMGLRDVKYEYTGGRGGWKGDVPVFAYDLGKIRAAGWAARHSSDEAVRLTVRAELGLEL